MASPRRLPLAALGLALLVAAAARADDWKYDTVVIKQDGGLKTLRGLVIDYKDTAPFVEVRVISRKPGERTKVATYYLDRDKIDSIDLLNDADRQVLKGRLKALDVSGKDLAERIRKLELERIEWRDGRKNGYRYEDACFVLESSAGEDLFRRSAVRLAQAYNAYNRALPARYHEVRPTTVLLAPSLAEYQAIVRERNFSFTNPAFYDPDRRQIVCGSDLERLAAQLEATRKEQQKALQDLAAQEAELNKLYKMRVPKELLRPIADARQQVRAAEAANEKGFQEATRQFFQRLYHEAFHAYVANFVYPPEKQEELPRWLDEGLAQIFETAIFEADEVRIGHADPDRLRRAQALLASGDLIPLGELLRSTTRQFQVAHGADRQTSDRHYVTSWALASYLAFEHKLLGSKALDDYARATFRKTDPVEAFCDLVGQPPSRLPQFEKDFRFYVQHLRKDGTVGKPR
jgi:hypothetical protein